MQKIKTLFISDVHLGTRKSQANKLLDVLKEYEFDNLIIIGDFIDLTALKKKFYWNEDHSTVIQKILRLSRKGVNVVYLLGNHDHFLRGLIKEEQFDINLGNILICDQYQYETSKGEKIFICHGDQFDGFIRLHPFLYVLGDFAYELSFKINKIYNKLRRILGLDYWSLSKYLKSKVKDCTIFTWGTSTIQKLKETNCDSIMIGHIHTPAIEKIDDKNYYNTGDFCESCSFLYEDLDGDIKLIILD